MEKEEEEWPSENNGACWDDYNEEGDEAAKEEPKQELSMFDSAHNL